MESRFCSFTCPRCGMTSFSPEDVLHGYCGACREFTRPEPVTWSCPGCGGTYSPSPRQRGPFACASCDPVQVMTPRYPAAGGYDAAAAEVAAFAGELQRLAGLTVSLTAQLTAAAAAELFGLPNDGAQGVLQERTSAEQPDYCAPGCQVCFPVREDTTPESAMRWVPGNAVW